MELYPPIMSNADPLLSPQQSTAHRPVRVPTALWDQHFAQLHPTCPVEEQLLFTRYGLRPRDMTGGLLNNCQQSDDLEGKPHTHNSNSSYMVAVLYPAHQLALAFLGIFVLL